MIEFRVRKNQNTKIIIPAKRGVSESNPQTKIGVVRPNRRRRGDFRRTDLGFGKQREGRGGERKRIGLAIGPSFWGRLISDKVYYCWDRAKILNRLGYGLTSPSNSFGACVTACFDTKLNFLMFLFILIILHVV